MVITDKSDELLKEIKITNRLLLKILEKIGGK